MTIDSRSPTRRSSPGGFLRGWSRKLVCGLALALPAAARGAAVEGTVRVDGACPKLAAVKVAKDASVCGVEQANEAVAAGPDGGLRNVVVSLHAVKPPAPA